MELHIFEGLHASLCNCKLLIYVECTLCMGILPALQAGCKGGLEPISAPPLEQAEKFGRKLVRN